MEGSHEKPHTRGSLRVNGFGKRAHKVKNNKNTISLQDLNWTGNYGVLLTNDGK